jgi:hypothetical protein
LVKSKGHDQMESKRHDTRLKDRAIKPTAENLIRWAGVSAMLAAVMYILVGLFHPLESLSTVTTAQWAIVHALAVAMSFFGVLGVTGLYARQVEASGWLGLAGFLLLSLWLVLLVPFTFAEVLILPSLATEAPEFVESFLGLFNRQPGEMDLGAIKMLWDLDGIVYILGGVAFGIATFRAGILPRIPAGLLAAGAALSPVGALLPLEFKALVAVPVGIALLWLGYAVWSERRAPAAAPVPTLSTPELRPAVAK